MLTNASKTNRLLSVMAASAKVGGGVHSTGELAYMMGESKGPVFTKFLADCVKRGVLRRVTNGLFESTITPPAPDVAIYKIVNKMRPGALNYISLESQLSHTGDISQVMAGRVTVVTKGRSGTFPTPYGVIEFTHTKKPVDGIAPNLYFDKDIAMYRANKDQALADLKSCNRNLHMLESVNA